MDSTDKGTLENYSEDDHLQINKFSLDQIRKGDEMEAVAIDTGLDGTKVYPECPCNELKIPLKSQQPIIVSMCH